MITIISVISDCIWKKTSSTTTLRIIYRHENFMIWNNFSWTNNLKLLILRMDDLKKCDNRYRPLFQEVFFGCLRFMRNDFIIRVSEINTNNKPLSEIWPILHSDLVLHQLLRKNLRWVYREEKCFTCWVMKIRTIFRMNSFFNNFLMQILINTIDDFTKFKTLWTEPRELVRQSSLVLPPHNRDNKINSNELFRYAHALGAIK